MSRKRNQAVRRAFSAATLGQVCVMPEEDFGPAYGMTTTDIDQPGPGHLFHFKDQGSSVLAVAHLDTVVDRDERAARFFRTKDHGPVVVSGALDDRLGAYTVLHMLPALGINVDVLLTTGEEYCASTAEHFQAAKKYNWMIEFDRGGTDVVAYQYEDAALRAAIRASGAVVGNGIFSDIGAMEHLGIKGVNWGVGYRDYHSVRGHAYLSEYFGMIGRYRRFHAANSETPMPHEQEEIPAWYRDYRPGWRYADVDSERDCPFCEAKGSVDPVTRYCAMCSTCIDCGDLEEEDLCYLPMRERLAALERRHFGSREDEDEDSREDEVTDAEIVAKGAMA
jgi:hypothetical protein